MNKYAIGVDFGTLSGRALLVDLQTGAEVAAAVHEYAHGVMDRELPCGAELGADWALQHPQDYLDVFANAIPQVMKEAGIDPSQVVGVGVDFTACTILPVKRDGTPLCFLPEFVNIPHAYVKLWKHHAAQADANRLNEIAARRKESFLRRYGGKISSEWVVPKVMQMVREAPEVYEAADRIIEAADWVVWQLTGAESRSACTAGYKAIWSKADGYPSDDFFKALDPRLEHLTGEKLGQVISPVGDKAGEITETAAKLTGLAPGTAVAVANVDAHVSLPAVGITCPGKMLMIMGTSTCHVLLGEKEIPIHGICGVVEDGIIPGFAGYEAGQSCVGDHFQWLVDNAVPGRYFQEAEARGLDIQSYLSELAGRLAPGESGLLALDWWNGNRSVLVDADLTGLMLGYTLQTKPEEVYRALIEATAFGTRMILWAFQMTGWQRAPVPVDELYACGGIAEKNPLMMQIYADVTNKPIKIGGSSQTPALGSAIFGAVAAGKARGGFDTIQEAAAVMAKVKEEAYRPIPEHVAVYDKLFMEYRQLHDYFGRDFNRVMKRLKAIKKG